MKKNNELPTPTVEEAPNPFSQAGEELALMESEGLLPETFDIRAACADKEFASLVQQFPVEAAVRIYDAEQRAARAEQDAKEKVQTELKKRGSLPRPQRGDSGISATPNYMAMSSDSFRNLESAMRAASRNGSRIKI